MVTGFSDGFAAGAETLLFEFYNGDAVFSLSVDAGAEAAHTGVPLEVLLNRRPQSTGCLLYTSTSKIRSAAATVDCNTLTMLTVSLMGSLLSLIHILLHDDLSALCNEGIEVSILGYEVGLRVYFDDSAYLLGSISNSVYLSLIHISSRRSPRISSRVLPREISASRNGKVSL